MEAYAPILESSCGGSALAHIEAYAPMLESGTASNAAIMLPKLATCMQSPNLARNQDSEQPWKLYVSTS